MSSALGEILETDRDLERMLVDYLRAHPDFFERHLDLLGSLRVSHPSGNAVSIVERHLQALRSENASLKHQLSDLVEVARENEGISRQLLRLVVVLGTAVDFDQAVACLHERLGVEFGIQRSSLRVLWSMRDGARPLSETLVPADDPSLAPLRPYLSLRRPVCGRLRPEVLQSLFGEAARHLGSAAVIPLDQGRLHGLLGLGSADPARFHGGRGTLFLAQLGEAVQQALHDRLFGNR